MTQVRLVPREEYDAALKAAFPQTEPDPPVVSMETTAREDDFLLRVWPSDARGFVKSFGVCESRVGKILKAKGLLRDPPMELLDAWHCGRRDRHLYFAMTEAGRDRVRVLTTQGRVPDRFTGGW